VTPADEIDALYGLPLEDFTKARNDLARRLRSESSRDEAAGVASLQKPTLPAWIVNQLARGRPADVRALLAAAEAIKKGADGADEKFRSAADRLVRAGRALLEAQGRRASNPVLEEVATTLRATAAVAPEELETARLTESREASGFDALAGVTISPGTKRAPAKAKTARPRVDRAAVDRARRALTEARDDAREARQRAATAEREARRAREQLDAAETRVADAEQRLESLRAER
jgi:hypothetical protein